METPKSYLSKRDNGTYCIIYNGLPLNDYMSKEKCISIAEKWSVRIDFVWDSLTGEFIKED